MSLFYVLVVFVNQSCINTTCTVVGVIFKRVKQRSGEQTSHLLLKSAVSTAVQTQSQAVCEKERVSYVKRHRESKRL